MVTLREYFTKDGAQNLTTHEIWDVTNKDTGEKYGEVVARLHFDFEAHAKYVSLFIPDMAGVELPEAFVLNDISKILKVPEERVGVQSGLGRTKGRKGPHIYRADLSIFRTVGARSPQGPADR